MKKARKNEHGTVVAGVYKKHFYGKEYEYESFVPRFVDREYVFQDSKISTHLEEAARYLAELNAYSDLVPDVDFFIHMHVRNEAVKSSKIEGIDTSINEAVLSEKEIEPERRDDWQEVQNYITAMNYGIERLQKLPLCMRLLCEMHAKLMHSVRGEHKQPGEVRSKQNWIGGVTIKTASFIPPHQDDVPALLKDLEKFWNDKNHLTMPNLIKVAISHYQFETIHPFNDGNGRIGRILIVIHLMQMGMLSKPTLYLSDFFETHKSAYYDALTFVRERNDLDQWILFFLSGIIETAKKGRGIFQNIVDLRSQYEKKLLHLGRRAKKANKLLQFAFSHPTFDTTVIADHLNMSRSSANTLVKEMVSMDILKESTGFSRNRMFTLHHYLNLFSA